MLILGGAATVTALTGMNTTVAGFLIPIFVIPYTYAGGLKATFMASYLHTAIIFAILLACVSRLDRLRRQVRPGGDLQHA